MAYYYYEIEHRAVANAVESLFADNDIDYVVINSDRVLEYGEEKLSEADSKEIIQELAERDDVNMSMLLDLFSDYDKKQLIRDLLGLNHIASVEDMCVALKEMFKY